MATRGWRPSWTNPGLTETPRPVLDLTVNRNLTIKGDTTVNGNLTVGGNINIPWNSYTPTLQAYTTALGLTPASGMAFTITGRWKAIGTLLFFYVHCNITNKGNAVSNFNIGLPPKLPVAQFSIHGTTQPPGNTDRSKVRSIAGLAEANASTVMIFPTDTVAWGGVSGSPGISQIYNMYDIVSTVPWEFNFSGFYESA